MLSINSDNSDEYRISPFHPNNTKNSAEHLTLITALIAENKALRHRLEESEKIIQLWYKNAM
jgi:hypothetical protein